MCSIDELLKDSDDEEEKKKPGKAGKQAGKQAGKAKKAESVAGKAWLQEGAEGDIMDFMDVAAAKKVMGNTLYYVY